MYSLSMDSGDVQLGFAGSSGLGIDSVQCVGAVERRSRYRTHQHDRVAARLYGEFEGVPDRLRSARNSGQSEALIRAVAENTSQSLRLHDPYRRAQYVAFFASGERRAVVGAVAKHRRRQRSQLHAQNRRYVDAAGWRRLCSAIKRAADNGLFHNVLRAARHRRPRTLVYNGVSQISGATVDDPELDRSPAAALSGLTNAIQQYTTAPDDITLAQALVTAATDMVKSLNQIDGDRSDGAGPMPMPTCRPRSATSTICWRSSRSINTDDREGYDAGDTSPTIWTRATAFCPGCRRRWASRCRPAPTTTWCIYTDSGVTLFETKARTVTHAADLCLYGWTVGQAVYIDGVPVTGANGVMPIKSGQLAGLAKLRDDVSVTYQSQLDEVARTVIEIFAESDQFGDPGAARRAAACSPMPAHRAMPPARPSSRSALAGSDQRQSAGRSDPGRRSAAWCGMAA